MESLVIPVGNTSKLKALLLAEESCPFDERGGGSSSINTNKNNATNDAAKTSKESFVSKRQSPSNTTRQQNRPPPPSRRLGSKDDQRYGTGSTKTTTTATTWSLPDRSNLDVARNKKRILEICYRSENTETATETATTGNQNSEMTANDGIEVLLKPLPTANEEAKDSPTENENSKNKKQKKDKKTKKKKKTSKKGEDEKQTEIIPRVKIQGGVRVVPLQDKDKIERNSNSIANPQDATEIKKKKITPDDGEKRMKVPPKGTATPTVTATSTARPSNTATTATTTKKKKKTRKVLRVVNRRDAAGRVVRKRLKGKRDTVVRKDCFRKGRDAKIGLATISEAFYDGLVNTDSDDDDDFSDDDEYECSSTSSNSNEDDDFSSDSNGDNDNDRNETNEVSSTTAGRRLRSAFSSDPQSDVRNNNNRTNPSNEDVPAPTEPGRIVDTIPDTDNTNEGRENSLEESASSVDSTACTSTASAEISRERKSMLCCFESCRIRTMVFTGMVFVIAVAAATVMLGYFFIFRKDIQSVSPTLAPSIAPNNVGQRPNFRPSQPQSDMPQPSSPFAPTPAPSTSILNTLSTSCYLPDDKPGTVTAEAEYAPEQFGLAAVSNSNTGYCGEGYLTILMIAGSGFGFASFEVDQTGYYKVALRYNNADKAKKALGLLIDDQDEGTFDLVSTGNEISWLVDDIDNVLLREGTHAIRVSVMETDDTIGPNVDWLTLVLQEPLSQFDYFSSLVAQANGMATQTLSQTRTLQWMVNEDSIDYSTLTDQEVIERYALIQIYHSVAGDTWGNNTQWLSELHACGWYGITCSKKDDVNLVTGLMLDSNGMVGYLPTDLSLLTNMIVISINKNDLQGTIPTQIGKLINLSKLSFRTNFLDGALPSELGSLEKLEIIDLGVNFLYGKVPEELYSMVRLEKLALGSNYLTGTLSTSVGQLKALKDLDLQISNLSGKIPTELGELTMLTSLALGRNQFTGQIPGELGLLKNLNLLDINSNLLTGTLPPELSLLGDNVIIDYSGNDVNVYVNI